MRNRTKTVIGSKTGTPFLSDKGGAKPAKPVKSFETGDKKRKSMLPDKDSKLKKSTKEVLNVFAIFTIGIV